MSLADIIFQRIPPAMLERVVYDQGILDDSQRRALFKASGLAPEQIALQTVQAYGTRTPELAFGLYELVYETNWETARLLFVHFQGAGIDNCNHQASLVGRIPTLPMEELGDFLRNVKRQVCLIVCRNGPNGVPVRGTGFLVGPRLVLTCEHVLSAFWAHNAIPADGSRVEIYFDFYYGDPVENVGPALPHARKVGLANAWRVEQRRHTRPDGIEGPLDQQNELRVATSLDFVLLQLDESIGLQPLSLGGGKRRGWITLSPDPISEHLRSQDWIIIPQHPHGFPQRIDLGRFTSHDQTGTRIRYLTNTAKGTSGAPCFNHQFKLVGVHNAYVGPEAQPLANQAIGLDHIAALVRPHILNQDRTHTLRWSISNDSKNPRVIMGRKVLLDWLQESAKPNPTQLCQRVYAAQATVGDAGCSFSIDVLNAETREAKAPRAIYGRRGQQLPSTAEDFLRSLLRELGIGPETGATMPSRPVKETSTGVLPPIAGEVDKLDRWLAEELPSWLGGVITKHVELMIDVRPAAAQAVETLERLGKPVDEDLRQRATAAEPVNVRQNTWDLAYVVIDDLRTNGYLGKGSGTELKGEVQALVAALVQGKPEQAMDSGLKRLRWMFLGYLPDFIAVADVDGNGAKFELLDPASVGQPEIIEIFDRMAQLHLPMQDVPPFVVCALAEGYIEELTDPEAVDKPRLAQLQAKINRYAKNLLQHMGG